MFVAKGAKEKILKKRQDAFFKEILPEIMLETKRLEIPIDQVIKFLKDYEG